MKRTALIFIVLGISLAIFMTCLGAYKSILLIHYERVEARVVSYTQESPGIVREGDWLLSYEFRAVDGATYQGHAIYAPKARLPDETKTVVVRYFPSAPNISGVDGSISITGMMGLIVAAWLIIRGLMLLVESKKTCPDGSSNKAPTNSNGNL
jgi:hypothetical protein